MNLKEKIEKKFKKLLNEGKAILQNCRWDGSNFDKFPSNQDYQRFAVETSNLVKLVCGESSDHYLRLQRHSEGPNIRANPYYFVDYYGMLQAASNDYLDDFLFNVRNLIRAELFDDFLSQAEYLLSEGYFLPAASLAGAVLEDSLRKLCDKYDIAYQEHTKIDPLNIELAKKQVYNRLIQKEITAKADIRNNADHGHFDKVKQSDVEHMVRWIRGSVSEHLK